LVPVRAVVFAVRVAHARALASLLRELVRIRVHVVDARRGLDVEDGPAVVIARVRVRAVVVRRAAVMVRLGLEAGLSVGEEGG
jgi:hypothetical protein